MWPKAQKNKGMTDNGVKFSGIAYDIIYQAYKSIIITSARLV
jgi:hypothetical protein